MKTSDLGGTSLEALRKDVGVAGWPRLGRFGPYRGGAAGRGSPTRDPPRNLLCQGTPVGSKASQPVPPSGVYYFMQGSNVVRGEGQAAAV